MTLRYPAIVVLPALGSSFEIPVAVRRFFISERQAAALALRAMPSRDADGARGLVL